MRRTVLLIVLLSGILAGPRAQAGNLQQMTGLARGLVAMPLGASEETIKDFADQGWIVYVQVASQEEASALGSTMADLGLLGHQVTVEAGKPGRLPLAGKLADVIYIQSPTQELTPEQLATWMASLAPRRGKLVIAEAKPEQLKKLGEQAQRLASLDKTEGVEIKLESLVLTPAPRPGSDQWTHRMHGPDNNLFSEDTSFHAPFLPQYYQLPIHESFWGPTVVSANGRLFTIQSSASIRQQPSLRARTLQNGLLLWERKFEKPEDAKFFFGGIYPCRSCLIADGDQLLLIEDEDILRLDAETGKELGRIEGPARKWESSRWLPAAAGLPWARRPTALLPSGRSWMSGARKRSAPTTTRAPATAGPSWPTAR